MDLNDHGTFTGVRRSDITFGLGNSRNEAVALAHAMEQERCHVVPIAYDNYSVEKQVSSSHVVAGNDLVNLPRQDESNLSMCGSCCDDENTHESSERQEACRYFDSGYCRFGNKRKYLHGPRNICHPEECLLKRKALRINNPRIIYSNGKATYSLALASNNMHYTISLTLVRYIIYNRLYECPNPKNGFVACVHSQKEQDLPRRRRHSAGCFSRSQQEQ